MVSGPGVVAGGASDALVNSTDMFTTIMEMAKIDPRTTVPKDVVIDSVSFLPYLSAPNAPSIRKWLYADVFDAGEPVARGQYAIRNDRYKLVVSNGQEELFDVIADRSETTNLLAGTLTPAQREAHTSLRTEVDALHASEKAN
jgi:arylsulfatase A-like enzyme